MDHESWPRNPNYEDNNILKSIFLAHSETGKDPSNSLQISLKICDQETK